MIFWALLALQVAALALAVWRLGRSALVVVLAYACVDNAVVEALHRFLFIGEAPVWHAIQRHGWPARAAYHLETALVTGWPALLAGAAWMVFGAQKPSGPGETEPLTRPWYSGDRPARAAKMRPTPLAVKARDLILLAYLIAAGGLVAIFPLPVGWTAPVLHGLELLFVAAALAAIPGGWKRRTITTREGQALLLLVAIELGVAILGAWGYGAAIFSREEWDRLSRLPYCVGWLGVCWTLVKRGK